MVSFYTVVYVSEWFQNIGKSLGFNTNSEKTNTEPQKTDGFDFDDDFETESFSFDDEFADFFDDDDDDIFSKIDFFTDANQPKGMKMFSYCVS